MIKFTNHITVRTLTVANIKIIVKLFLAKDLKFRANLKLKNNNIWQPHIFYTLGISPCPLNKHLKIRKYVFIGMLKLPRPDLTKVLLTFLQCNLFSTTLLIKRNQVFKFAFPFFLYLATTEEWLDRATLFLAKNSKFNRSHKKIN